MGDEVVTQMERATLIAQIANAMSVARSAAAHFNQIVAGNQITYNPAIAASTGNVFKTWQEVMTSAAGFIAVGASYTIVFATNEGPTAIPVGSWTIGPNCTWAGQDIHTGVVTTAAGAVSFDHDPATYWQCNVESTATTPLFTTQTRLITVLFNSTLLTATAPIYSYATGTNQIMFLFGNSAFLNIGAPVMRRHSGTIIEFQFHLFDLATIASNTVDCDNSWSVYLDSPAATFSPTQVGTSATVVLSALGTLIDYSDPAPSLGAAAVGALGIPDVDDAITALKKGATTTAAALTVSANTIAPTAAVQHCGAGLIKTITPGAGFSAQVLCIIPDAAFTYDATGNILVPVGGGLAVVDKLMVFAFDGTKWTPSY